MKKFLVVLTQDKEQPSIVNVDVPQLPGCHTFGYGREEALAMAKEAIECYLQDEVDSEPLKYELTEIEV